MTSLRIILIIGMAAPLALSAGTQDRTQTADDGKVPPVLQNSDPVDTGVITLPGLPPTAMTAPLTPAPAPAPSPAKPAPDRGKAASNAPQANPAPAKPSAKTAPAPETAKTAPVKPASQPEPAKSDTKAASAKPSPMPASAKPSPMPVKAAETAKTTPPKPEPAKPDAKAAFVKPAPVPAKVTETAKTAPPKPEPAKPDSKAPAAKPAPAPAKAAETAKPALVKPVPKPEPVKADAKAVSPKPAPEPAKAPEPAPKATKPNGAYPPEFEKESSAFLHQRIGQWTAADARTLLGAPLRQRAAVNEDNSVNGRIYAFNDPTGRYKELELDFDKDKGLLRTVFVYPYHLTWQECRRLFGGEVSATKANKGRIFYSYQNRRLDVLVDDTGSVISLGLY